MSPSQDVDPVNAEIIKKLRFWHEGKKEPQGILSTHRMSLWHLLCDQVAMINRSKKILDGQLNRFKSKAFRPEVYSIYD